MEPLKFLDGDMFEEMKILQQNLQAGDFHKILTSPLGRFILSHGGSPSPRPSSDITVRSWDHNTSSILQKIAEVESVRELDSIRESIAILGIAALHAFLQSNVTGPPLAWSSAEVIFSGVLSEEVQSLRTNMLASLTVDGEAVYQLIPNVELFSFAKTILNDPDVVLREDDRRWSRLRVNFWHQQMLDENSASLQRLIYDDLDYLASIVLPEGLRFGRGAKIQFLLERAAVHTHHGHDAKARDDLRRATKLSGFEYVLTGRLGKRTKFQQNDLSQLIVLAKSAEKDLAGHLKNDYDASVSFETTKGSKPQNLDLNDDTLLESISFAKTTSDREVQPDDSMSPSLAALDPANQPALRPLDSIILLSLASSITNTSPQHGLTREETLPYATRVLEGGSTNWQVYTQALLVRSRIEGYRSRTVERGVLQLQALVDQVIAETTSSQRPNEAIDKSTSTTFLPRPKPSESASVEERLMYIHQLASPTRWKLEAELAARWVSLGGLRTALEIYERLEMWAETALCWAAVEREDKARKIARRQLYLPSPASTNVLSSQESAEADEDAEEYLGPERDFLPADAPRLFCILGDIDKSPSLYERAWEVSKQRYARAQRSLGKHYLSINDFPKAEIAYSKSLKINPLNASTWFALGCIRLELQDFPGAVDAFGRTVQIEQEDAEAWSNLAAALLRLPVSEPAPISSPLSYENENTIRQEERSDPERHTKEAFVALKRAATLNRNSHRIWQNVLNVSARLSPPPFTDIIIAQQRLIELRGSAEGESCIDTEIMEGVLSHVITLAPPKSTEAGYESVNGERTRGTRHGLERSFTKLVNEHIKPLITHSRRLWLLIARLALHQNHPSIALEAYEKAWRVMTQRPGWEGSGSSVGKDETPESVWADVVDATIELVDAYESLGERKRTEGLGAGGMRSVDEEGAGGEREEKGEMVCPTWKFKARSAIRSVMGKGKEVWEGSEGWKRLEERKADLGSGR
ncbi:MAG: hypothetical protein MMC33_009058 [Icmadophila ericetorum]|nr:hypothetical protein [Icmadophila ericetorum]